jgi:hypothetical protein
MFAEFLEIVDKTIDSMGGLPVLLGVIGSLLLQTFSGKIANGINNLSSSFS